MSRSGIWFLVIIILNTIVCLLFLFWGYVQQLIDDDSKKKKTQMTMPGYYIQTFVMFICPIIGPVFFVTAQVIYAKFFKEGADLADVIFGKDKVVAPRAAEEEVERNRVPLEEALAVSDKASLRGLMLDVVRGDVSRSLSSINHALNSQDSETAHYAATVLREALNDFRQRSQELYNLMKQDYIQPEEYACMLIEYMSGVLRQDVFTEMELVGYVDMMEEACYFLYKDEEIRPRLTSEYIEWMALILLKIRAYERMKFWCDRQLEMFPNELSSYTIRLKLYFSMEDRENFFATMEQLRKADVVIDKETLELIRIFS